MLLTTYMLLICMHFVVRTTPDTGELVSSTDHAVQMQHSMYANLAQDGVRFLPLLFE